MTNNNLVITRDNEHIKFLGYRFSSWELLRESLGICSFIQDCIFSDLSLGAWRGHWVERELCKQLNIPFEGDIQPMIKNYLNDDDSAEMIGKLIDNESKGDINFIMSYNNCQRIIPLLVEATIKYVVIIAPGKGFLWEKDNVDFIYLLQKGLQFFDCEVIILTYAETLFPKSWNVIFYNKTCFTKDKKLYCPIPGIIHSRLLKKLIPSLLSSSSVLELRNNFFLISPDLRIRKIISQDYVKNLKRVIVLGYLASSIEYFFPTNNQRAFDTLMLEASKRFVEGGYKIALRMLEKLLKEFQLEDNIRFSVIAKIQNIRISLMYFTEAANENIDFDLVSDYHKASLYQSKAWGLVMTNRPQEAEEYFELAKKFLNKEKYPSLYLYMLNISALNKLKLGYSDEALLLEKKIENALYQQKKINWHIFYVNAINLARLYKKEKSYLQAESYYKKAFAVNLNLKNDNDLLYSNFCFAQLYEIQEEYKKALIFFLRTCIHWLSNEIPEALAPRVVQAILGKSLSKNAAEVEEISKYLLTSVNNILVKLGYDLKKTTTYDLIFKKIHISDANLYLRAVGINGLCVFLSDVKQAPFYTGANYNELLQCVSTLLHELLPEFITSGSIIVDDQYGIEMPASIVELISSCTRYNIHYIHFANKKFLFNKQKLIKLFLSSKIYISDAVSAIITDKSSLTVIYKRYKDSLILTGLKKALLESLDQCQKVSDICNKYGNYRLIATSLRSMERDSIIYIVPCDVGSR